VLLFIIQTWVNQAHKAPWESLVWHNQASPQACYHMQKAEEEQANRKGFMIFWKFCSAIYFTPNESSSEAVSPACQEDGE
jgi:hypothetical protein